MPAFLTRLGPIANTPEKSGVENMQTRLKFCAGYRYGNRVRVDTGKRKKKKTDRCELGHFDTCTEAFVQCLAIF